MNKKLFKPLMEQVELNKVKESVASMSDAEKALTEKEVVFDNMNDTIVEMVDFAEASK